MKSLPLLLGCCLAVACVAPHAEADTAQAATNSPAPVTPSTTPRYPGETPWVPIYMTTYGQGSGAAYGGAADASITFRGAGSSDYRQFFRPSTVKSQPDHGTDGGVAGNPARPVSAQASAAGASHVSR